VSAPDLAYKVLTEAEMRAFERDGVFEGSEVDRRDSYVHLSTCDQLTETVDKHFAGQDDLWTVAVDLVAHGDKVKWEPSRGGQLFPHLYEPMRLEAVTAYSPLRRDEDGSVRLPVAG
jgi:uncharacterized protein (DUF952 family)